MAFIQAVLILAASFVMEPEMVAPVDNRAIIEAFVAAYNERDLEGMGALAHPNIEWIGVEGSQATVFSEGKDALMEQMRGQFESGYEGTSDLQGWTVNQDFLAVTETARWTGRDGEARAQSSLAVYEIEDGLIRRVWYYPSQ